MDEIKRAEELLRKGRYPKAIEILRELLTDDPDNAQLRARVGEAYRLAGNLERAFHHFNKSAALFTRGGDTVTACHMLKAANTVSPNEPDILFRMAECLQTIGNLPELEMVLRQLIAVASASGDRRRLWALEQLCGLHPEDMDLETMRAAALGEAGRIEESVTAWKRVSAHLEVLGVDFVPMLRKAAEIAEERPDVGVDLADVLLIARKPRDALALLVPFYEKFPEDIGVLGALVKALEQLGAVDKVVPARIELIKARVKRGHRELAFQEVARLMELAPNNPLALEVSAHTYSTFGFRGDATNLWRKLVQLHDQQGRSTERDRAILMLLKVNPDDPEALRLGARALRAAGKEAEAAALEGRISEVAEKEPSLSLPRAPFDDPDPDTEGLVPAVSASSGLSYPTSEREHEVMEEFGSFDYPSDAFAPVEDSEPAVEQLPISINPFGDHVTADRSDATRPLPPLEEEASLDEPEMVPTRATERYQAAELHLPEERASGNEETTSRMELGDELLSLRQAFQEEDPTRMDIRSEEETTLLPPDEFEEFTSRTRSQLVSDLLRETTKNDT